LIILVDKKEPDGYLTEQEELAENNRIIYEMATLRKMSTGLPVNLYLDDNGAWKKSGHWKRIKFQPDPGNRPVTKNMVSMSIEDDPKILQKNAKIALSAQEIEKIKLFVRLNKDNLLKLGDTIDIADFVKQMKTV
jgi:hypothetical protein